jgi:Recombination endonuclease VII
VISLRAAGGCRALRTIAPVVLDTGASAARAKALEDHRQRKTERRHGKTLNTPAARARWRLTHKLKRYGLTQEQFDRLLEIQGYACAMCSELFEDGQAIFIDHDHNCCEEEKSSCGECVRGLLCLRCNTALGYIERYGERAEAYLASRKEWIS